jgi:hypothetical protein
VVHPLVPDITVVGEPEHGVAEGELGAQVDRDPQVLAHPGEREGERVVALGEVDDVQRPLWPVREVLPWPAVVTGAVADVQRVGLAHRGADRGLEQADVDRAVNRHVLGRVECWALPVELLPDPDALLRRREWQSRVLEVRHRGRPCLSG